MAKLTLEDVTNLEATSLVAAVNLNSAATEEALENTLSRDGTSPNTMDTDLDMNSRRIYNLGDAISGTDAISKSYLLLSLEGSGALAGDKGWSPILAVVADGTRRVLEVIDWTGGEGEEPDAGLYVGPTGLTSVIGDAVDIRGPAGAGTGDLLSTNNLSDLANAVTALTNIGAAALVHTHAVADLSDASANAKSFLVAVNYAAMRTLLGFGELSLLAFTDLVYAGSTSSNVTYPVGSTVAAYDTAGSTPNRNASATIRLHTGGSYGYANSGTGSILTGTWRNRGLSGEAAGINVYLFQRTA